MNEILILGVTCQEALHRFPAANGLHNEGSSSRVTNQEFVYPSVLCLEGTHIGYLRPMLWHWAAIVGVGGLVEHSEIPVGDEKPNGSADLTF